MSGTNLIVISEFQFAEATESLVYTSTNVITRIDKIIAQNQDISSQDFIIYLVKEGESVSTENGVTYSLDAGEISSFPEVQNNYLYPGGMIYIKASAGGVVNFRISGATITV